MLKQTRVSSQVSLRREERKKKIWEFNQAYDVYTPPLWLPYFIRDLIN